MGRLSLTLVIVSMNTFSKQEYKAQQLLKKPENYPNLIEREEFERKLLVFCYPSFKPYTSWALFKTQNTYWLRRVTWDRSLRFPSYEAEPHTFGCEVCFQNNLAEKILLSLSLISLNPFVQPNVVGVDGTIYGIEVGNHWFSCSLRWWCSPPHNWKALNYWYQETVDIFETALPDRTL